MQKALDDFEACMRRVRALHALYFSFAARLTAAVDLSDILRPEVVLAVSALDYFIHELTRIGIAEGPKVRLTRRWREVDSNCRSRSEESGRSRRTT